VRSLRSRLLILWLLSLAASAAVGVLLVQLYQLSASAQSARTEAVVARACDLLRDRYAAYAAGWAGPTPPPGDGRFRAELAAAASLALAGQQGVEGGYWQADTGALAYAFPTYQGTGPKTDLPAAELGRIAEANADAARGDAAVLRVAQSGTQTLLLQACPITAGPVVGLTGWAMARSTGAPGYGRMQWGLGVLGALVVAMSGWLSWLAVGWSRKTSRLEAALRQHDVADLPRLAFTGERELDRIVAALNEAGERLAAARTQADAMARRVADSERLAALGRVAAGLAHEVRNPLAAMRLRAENALATGDDGRRRDALAAVLGQVARLDALVADLLAMTHRRAPDPAPMDLAALLDGVWEGHEAQAAAAGIALHMDCLALTVRLDAAAMGRCLGNLVQNAIQHSPAGGCVSVRAEVRDGALRLVVSDTGPGVASALAASLFEPFVTSRPEGTGLGLAIARELAEAQGGRLTLLHPGGDGQGAAFLVKLPEEAGWRAS